MIVWLSLVLLAGGEDLPLTLGQDPAPPPPPPGKEEIIAVEAFVLSTTFDEGLSLDRAVGIGADLNFRWRWNGKTRFGFNIGAVTWDTETDLGGLTDQDADIVQYRAGVGFEFPFSKAEIGIGSNIGVYRFATSGDSDSSPYVEFEGSLGFRPIPPLKIGGLLMATYTQSSFTRSHTHLFGNYSAGLGVEWSF